MVVSYHLMRDFQRRLLDTPADTARNGLSLVYSFWLHGYTCLQWTHLLLEEPTECWVVSSVSEIEFVCFCVIDLFSSLKATIRLRPRELQGFHLVIISSCLYKAIVLVFLQNVLKRFSHILIIEGYVYRVVVLSAFAIEDIFRFVYFRCIPIC